MGRVTKNSADSTAGERVPKVKVRFDKGTVLLLDKGFRSKGQTRKSNSEGTHGKTAKIFGSDPSVVKKFGDTEFKLAGLPSMEAIKEREHHQKLSKGSELKKCSNISRGEANQKQRLGRESSPPDVK